GVSSSGSAAAVAAKMVPVSIGTQTGGSIIRPASYCGVIGYKATYGAFATDGVKENTKSLDTLGFFVRSIDDITLFRAAMLGLPKPRDNCTIEAANLRIGICRTPFWEEADESLRQQIEEASSRLAKAGAQVT